MAFVTLLVNFYMSKGIVFAAGKAVTLRTVGAASSAGRRGQTAQGAQGCSTRADGTGGAVGFFGLAVVGDEPMDKWLRPGLSAFGVVPLGAGPNR